MELQNKKKDHQLGIPYGILFAHRDREPKFLKCHNPRFTMPGTPSILIYMTF